MRRVSVRRGGLCIPIKEERPVEGDVAGCIVIDGTDVPVGRVAVLACHDDVFAYIARKQAGLLPVARHIANELELSGVLHIVLGQVARHLERRVHSNKESELVGNSRVYAGVRLHGVVETENTRGIVGRTGKHTCIRERSHMGSGTSAVCTPCVPLLPADTLLGEEIGVCTAETGRHHGFMVVDADMVASRGLDDTAVVAHTRLGAVVLLAVHGGDDGADIARLNRVHTVMLHIVVRLVQFVLILGSVALCLVVEDNLHAAAVGILSQIIDIVVGIGFDKRELGIGVGAVPCFPTFVPALGEDTAETIVGSEINVTLHIFGSGTMDRSLAPRHRLEVHTPPYTDELHRVNPRSVFDTAGFVEVEHDARCHECGQVVGDDHHTPRGLPYA